MPTYMTQFNYTREAWAKLLKNPEDRSKPVTELLESLGGKLLGLYYLAGDYDGFIIYEAPDANTAATGIVAAAAAGHLRTTKTSQLYSMSEAMEIVANAGKIAFAAPKG